MTTEDLQRVLVKFKTVAVLDTGTDTSEPFTVRVHEALPTLSPIFAHTKHRYFLSVNFKFRLSDAENIGKPGWFGCTKSEAMRDAKSLAAALASASEALCSAREHALSWDTFTNRYTEKLQQQRLDKLTSRYRSVIAESLES